MKIEYNVVKRLVIEQDYTVMADSEFNAIYYSDKLHSKWLDTIEQSPEMASDLVYDLRDTWETHRIDQEFPDEVHAVVMDLKRVWVRSGECYTTNDFASKTDFMFSSYEDLENALKLTNNTWTNIYHTNE